MNSYTNKQERPKKGIAVDCGCKGNPGKAEFRGVNIETGKTIFHLEIPGLSTNNVAEFLAAVTGLRYANKLRLPVYSDSKCAIAWIRKKKCNTKIQIDNEHQKALIQAAEIFLNENRNNYVHFWVNYLYGEIPADLSGIKGVKKITYQQFKAQRILNENTHK